MGSFTSLWAVKLFLHRQHDIKDEDTTVRRFLQREADLYHLNAEVPYLNERFDLNVLQCY